MDAVERQIAEIDARLEELMDEVYEYEARLWLRDLYYLRDEGFLEIDGDRCYFKENACPLHP